MNLYLIVPACIMALMLVANFSYDLGAHREMLRRLLDDKLKSDALICEDVLRRIKLLAVIVSNNGDTGSILQAALADTTPVIVNGILNMVFDEKISERIAADESFQLFLKSKHADKKLREKVELYLAMK